jgi:prolyl-tRNA synthetase
MDKKNDAITSRDVDFAKWYTDVCRKADLMDYYSVKGFIDYLPYSYAIWEEIQAYLNRRFKENGAENVYLPMVIPQSLMAKEKEHVEGFAPECLVATIGGGQTLADPLIIRPTSEIVFSELFKKRISSYRDLPIRYNQWCSVVRWEKTTRPFLRGSEFLWQEGHCLFETEEEARENALAMQQVYNECGRDLLAIPFLTGEKTEHEKFAGAVATYSLEALMHDGKALQSGTSHYLGQGFAKAYGIQFLGRNNALETPHQTSWGVSTRLLGAIIMVHGDDNGLVLPPYVAPIQVVIVPIRQDAEGVLDACKKLNEELKAKGIRVKLDADDNHTPGWKFAQYEMKGVPLRIEIGPRDLAKGQAMLTERVNGEKTLVPLEGLAEKIPGLLHDIHISMYQKAKENLENHITDVSSIEEMNRVLNEKGGFCRMAYCGEAECELAIKAATNGATARCIASHLNEDTTLRCPICGKPAKIVAYFARAY